MRPLADEIAGEHELVAACIGADLHSVLHHELADALALKLWADDNILYDPCGRTVMSEIVHDEQSKGAYNLASTFGEVDAVVGISSDLGKYLFGSWQAHGWVVFVVEDAVEFEQSGDVFPGSFANIDFHISSNT